MELIEKQIETIDTNIKTLDFATGLNTVTEKEEFTDKLEQFKDVVSSYLGTTDNQ